MDTKQIAAIGLGIMGGAIASALVAGGWKVSGYDPEGERGRLAALSGVDVCNTLADAISSAGIVFTSLPNAKALHEVARVLANSIPTKVAVEMSTLGLEDKLSFRDVLQDAGHRAVDCPISGTGAQAAEKDLVIYASGDGPTITSLVPCFMSFSKRVFDVGPFGNGTRMKLVANTLVAIHNVATAEAILLAKRAGLEAEQAAEVLAEGAGSSCVFRQRAPMMANGSYVPASMRLSLFQKDLDLIRNFSLACHSPTPLFTTTLPIYRRAIALGYGDCDTAAVMPALEWGDA